MPPEAAWEILFRVSDFLSSSDAGDVHGFEWSLVDAVYDLLK
jgi:hypothetical protein